MLLWLLFRMLWRNEWIVLNQQIYISMVELDLKKILFNSTQLMCIKCICNSVYVRLLFFRFNYFLTSDQNYSMYQVPHFYVISNWFILIMPMSWHIFRLFMKCKLKLKYCPTKKLNFEVFCQLTRITETQTKTRRTISKLDMSRDIKI